MPDIRRTSQIDDFERANENPIQPPWFTVAGSQNCQLSGGALKGTTFPPNSNLAYYEPTSWAGRHGEAWGIAGGSPAETAGWRIAILQTPGVSPSGYTILPHNPIGTNGWIFRRIDGGSVVGLGTISPAELDENDICMIRLDGDKFQGWRSADGGANWTLVGEFTDNTYSGPFYACFGTTGTETSWKAVGGTPHGSGRPRYIRRPHRRGAGLLVP